MNHTISYSVHVINKAGVSPVAVMYCHKRNAISVGRGEGDQDTTRDKYLIDLIIIMRGQKGTSLYLNMHM